MTDTLNTDPLKGAEKEMKDLTKQRDEVCIPIVREIFKKLGARANLLMGPASQIDLLDFYNEVYSMDIIPLLMREDFKVVYLEYVFNLMMQVVGNVQDRTLISINHRTDQMVAKKLGLEDKNDLTIPQLDRELKALFPKAVDNSVDKKA